jgi:putative endonuclease
VSVPHAAAILGESNPVAADARELPSDAQSYVYVLGCLTSTGHLTYVGWTSDLARRIEQHNSGRGARSTRGRVWTVLYWEACASKRHAMSREWHLKRDRALRRRLAAALLYERATI